MAQNYNNNNGCGCIGASIAAIIGGVYMTFVFTINKIQGNFFLTPTGVYSNPIETEGPLAEIVGLAKVVGAPKEERGGWSLLDLQGISGWVKTANLSQVNLGRLGKAEGIIWKGNNITVGKTQNANLEAVSGEFLMKFGDELYPYAKSKDRLFYYAPNDRPVSFMRSTFPSAPVTELDESASVPLSDDGTQYTANDCNFYYLNTTSGRLSPAGVLPAGTPVKLGKPNFPFNGRTPEVRILLGEFPARSDLPCVITLPEATITATKPGIVPDPIQWNK